MNQGLSPLVADFANGVVEPLGGTVATIAAGEDDHACAKSSEDTFFHVYKLLIIWCFSFVKNIRKNTGIC